MAREQGQSGRGGRLSLRLDQLLVERALAGSRSQARRWIEAGRVQVAAHASVGAAKPAGEPVWETLTRPAQRLEQAARLRILPDPADRYVSRGGLKLAGALGHTGLNVARLSVLDIGQSTGGFSDCLLQGDAARVVGVDVGHGQLHPRLRDLPRLHCLEGINARELPRDALLAANQGERFELMVMDVSFISQTLILPGLPPLLQPGGHLLSLVKPQFEVGREGIGKGGLVRDPALYVEVEARIRACCASAGLEVLDWFYSPITGGDGNREFFVYARRGGGFVGRSRETSGVGGDAGLRALR